MTMYCKGLMALALLVIAPLAASAAPTTPSQRLASAFIRTAMTRTMDDPLTIDTINGAITLTEEALQLDPDNADLWRLALDLALLAEHDDLRVRAVERLARLDPADEAVRLMRLDAAIDRYQTAPERIAAYEKLLAPDNMPRLGPPVASRLALDLALLYRREGDMEQFSTWLSQSIAQDSANRSAAAIAAGFFRMNVRDAQGEAELLTNLMLADPTDIATQVALAQLLLEHGAYTGAARIYRLAILGSQALGNPPANDLLADQAIAQWAAGDQNEALETLRKRQSDMDTLVRAQAKRNNADLSAIDLAKLSAQVDPTLATVAAVIHSGRHDDQAPASITAAIAAYQAKIDTLKKAKPENADPEKQAQLFLEMAWVSLWLGGDLQSVPGFIAAAEESQPLSQEAKNRFEGWLAYRRGELAKAAELLTPIASNDAAAGIGLALALLDQGRRQDAARQFLAANRSQPGSLIGIWAAGQIVNLLGQRMPLSDEAVKLEHLISSISAQFDRYPDDSSLAIAMRIVPSKLTFAPYEPIIFSIEITNNSFLPLTLDRDGPIRPQVIFSPIVNSASSQNLQPLRPIIVNIGRRLRLLPGEILTIPVDLRNYHPAEVINSLALNGTIVRLRAYLNFAAGLQGALRTSIYGTQTDAPIMWVEGQRVTEQWVKDTMTAIQGASNPDLLPRMALLSRAIAPNISAPDATAKSPVQDPKLLDAARAAFEDTYQKLDPVSQAWLLSVMPVNQPGASEGMQATLAMARKSENRLVRIAYLLYHAVGANDVMFDAAKRGDDPAVRQLAEIVQRDARKAALAPPKQ